MQTISSVSPDDVPHARADVARAAVARAAQRTGVDFDYLIAQARIESDMRPDARAPTSSASGLYQFIESTWLETLDRHGAKHGMSWAEEAIGPGGRVGDADTRDHLLSLRFDPDTASLMAAELARDNSAGLQATLGREPEPTELYLAHFLGLSGAQQFLGALESNPDQSAAALMPQAARANRAIFFDNGQPRSVAGVMDLLDGKVDAAMQQAGAPPAMSPSAAMSRWAAGYPASHPAHTRIAPSMGSPGSGPPLRPGNLASQPSMSQTLQATFGASDALSGRPGQQVTSAYNKLRAFGL